MDQLQFDSITKTFICTTCLAKSHPSMAPVSRAAKSGGQGKAAEGQAKPTIFGKPPKEKVVTYACADCKYRFKKKEGKEATSCPYCGGSKVSEVSNEAAKILADSDKYDF
jgi:DNA-directed RNA polymerase subunit RPC12/RpoP